MREKERIVLLKFDYLTFDSPHIYVTQTLPRNAKRYRFELLRSFRLLCTNWLLISLNVHWIISKLMMLRSNHWP